MARQSSSFRFPKYLYGAYAIMRDKEFVHMRRVLTEPEVAELQIVLNKAIPGPDDEEDYYKMLMMHDMCSLDATAVASMFWSKSSRQPAKLQPFVLWCDVATIMEYYRLSGRVNMTWNPKTRLFTLTPIVAKPRAAPAAARKDADGWEEPVRRGGRKQRHVAAEPAQLTEPAPASPAGAPAISEHDFAEAMAAVQIGTGAWGDAADEGKN
jgi:hypothetical protein